MFLDIHALVLRNFFSDIYPLYRMIESIYIILIVSSVHAISDLDPGSKLRNNLWVNLNRPYNAAMKYPQESPGTSLPIQDVVHRTHLPHLLRIYTEIELPLQILSEEEFGSPLILTPYLEKGKIKEARKASLVDSALFPLPSYTGFFTVNSAYNSNIFFWFIPAKTSPVTAPVILWLQGGPGGSSMFGLFVEHGPFHVSKTLDLSSRNITWSSNFNMIYIDQPVGTGFSFTDDDIGFAKNQIEVANDLYSALTQFFTMFSYLQANDFYITGESYAGKYIPAISYKIHQMNMKGAKPKIPLKGIAIGDGLCDPINQMDYGDFIYEVGLTDENGRALFMKMTASIQKYIKNHQWDKATNAFDEMLDLYEYQTGLSFVYNFLLNGQPDAFSYYPKFLNQPHVRKAIHVGNATFGNLSLKVYNNLKEDIPKTIAPWLVAILNASYKVMIYSGQVDIIVAHPQTEHFIAQLPWKGQQAYHKTKRVIWKVGKEVAGYAREVHNFKQVMVRNAGHILPYDQPKWAFDMIQRFIADKTFASV